MAQRPAWRRGVALIMFHQSCDLTSGEAIFDGFSCRLA
jgi:hypothetical protein